MQGTVDQPAGGGAQPSPPTLMQGPYRQPRNPPADWPTSARALRLRELVAVLGVVAIVDIGCFDGDRVAAGGVAAALLVR